LASWEVATLVPMHQWEVARESLVGSNVEVKGPPSIGEQCYVYSNNILDRHAKRMFYPLPIDGELDLTQKFRQSLL